MSTEIKNTLFRFVTMRSPELADEKTIKNRFVFYNSRKSETEIRGFENAVNNKPSTQSKWEAMSEFAESFSTTALNETDVKGISPALYEFGVWMAKNKHSFTVEELDSKILGLAGEQLNTEKLNTLWDNLFYQVITKKDFYTKEAIMHLLIGNHLSQTDASCRTSLETLQQVAKAKVVLPRTLFVEDDGASNGSISRIASKQSNSNDKVRRTGPSATMKKSREIHEAQTKIRSLRKLQKELEKAERRFKKEYKEAYDLAVKTHQVEIKKLQSDYEDDVKKAKETWCNLQDPQTTLDPNNPCNQPAEVKVPDYPEFEFSFKNEMDWGELEQQLSTESLKTLLTLLEIEFETAATGKVELSPSEDLSGEGHTFSQTHQEITNAIAQNHGRIISNLPQKENVSVSMGGVIVPVSRGSSAAPYSVILCPVNTSQGKLLFEVEIEVPDLTWEIEESNSHHEVVGSGVVTSGLFFASQTGNTILLKTADIHSHSHSLIATSFDGTIAFKNGMKVTFSIPNPATASFYKSCYSGDLGVSEVTGDGNHNENGTGPTNFIPSGFGFKQIGIADYKKVEQTTQGYVEGDVAHIENIMAREYKEKATRRLRRSENTTTSSTESEKEKLTDTTSTDRYEMQTEVAKILQEATDFAANANASYNGGLGSNSSYSIGGNVNMATHSSQEESTLNAVNQAKEITERAMERIVSKVKEERIEKIIEEFEENNKHGFDNTKGDKHVVGVYRWVDKIFKNQVYNYGKRLMFEFMIPQPSKLHILGMEENSQTTKLVEPEDPRKYEDLSSTPDEDKLNLKDFTCINEKTAKFWGGVFNVELKPCPDLVVKVGKSFAQNKNSKESGFTESKTDAVKIPEGYLSQSASLFLNNASAFGWENGLGTGLQNLAVPGKFLYNQMESLTEFPVPGYKDELPVAYFAAALHASSATVEVKCVLSEEAKQKWQQETFKAIIDAYEEALVEYNQKLAEENALAVKIKGENPGFYRQIENMILRKNCISYLISQDPQAARTYGKSMFNSLNTGVKRTFGNHEVSVSAELDDYAAFVKFMEQAFEWEIMSYNFYPYYWGQRKDWGSLYQYDNNDPLFRNFMQAGMARVIVTVRPGFEEAVRFYLQTGEIWNGGEVPVIEDPLFLSLVDELQSPKGKKEGKAWATRLPTALTILQAKNIGLNVTQALPFDTDALSEFENPSEVPISGGLETNDSLLGTSQSGRIAGRILGNENKEAKITLSSLNDQLQALTYCDADGNFELNSIPVGTYQLNLDANNDFPTTTHQVTVGSKIQQVVITADWLTEINMTVAPLD